MEKKVIKSVLRTCIRFSGILPAVLIFVMALSMSNCSKDVIKSQTDNSEKALGIAETIPADQADSVVINPVITVKLKAVMSSSDISASTIILKQGTSIITGIVTHSENTISFTPDTDLNPEMQYTARFVVKIMKDGDSDDREHIWTFRTGKKRGYGPTITSVSPVNLATSVPINVTPKVTFTREMRSSSINTSTFILKQGSTIIPGTISCNEKTATFKPSALLSANSVYTAVITTGVKDEEGRSMEKNYTWSFTTAGSTENAAPTVASTSPANNATNIPVDVKPSVNFSEAMDASTISVSNIALKQGTTTVNGSLTYSGNTAVFAPAAALSPSTLYIMTVSTDVKDASGKAMASSYSFSFTTAAVTPSDVIPPVVSAVVPSNNSTGILTNTKVTATFSEAMNASTINTSTVTLKQGTTDIAATVALAGNTVTLTPSSVLANGLVYTATITTGVKDAAGNALAANYSWSFTTAAAADVTPPTVSSVAPANNATGIATNSKVTATFSEAMDASTITASTVMLKQGTTAVAATVASSGNTVTLTPSSVLANGVVYTATITTGVKDAAGNALAANYSWSFTTAAAADITPPTVSSVLPANNSTGIATNSKVTATFSEAIDASTITASTVMLKQGTTAVAGTVALSGNTVTFTPSLVLANSVVYTATITTGVKDAAGNALAANYSWSFTTAAPADVTPPTVSSVLPANNATGIATNSKVTATFSEAMNASTITTSTVTLKQGTTAVAGTVALSGNTVTLTPSSVLVDGVVYTATITTGVKDAAGNALAANYSWTFTTAAPADVTPPTVSSVSPANNATGIATNSIVTATFSEAMNASTITTSTVTLKQGTTSIAGTVSMSGNTVTLTPSLVLANGVVYTATITTGVKDAAGNALAANYSWSFTTAAPADVTPPTVSSVIPANNATGIATNSKVNVTFSEAMNASTINTTTFTLKQGTTTVSGTVTLSGNTATFTPSSPLANGVVYTATVTTGAKDAAGNAITANYSWNFTTAAAVISFSTQVFPIVQAKCMPCHGATSPAAGISLTNYTQVKAIGSRLDNTSMYSKMGVTTAEQTIIKAWLAAGSPNN